MEAFLIFLGVIVDIIFWYCVAAEFRRIAVMKGHNEARYFWWTFLIAPIGMLMVVALPNDNKPSETVVSDELPEI